MKKRSLYGIAMVILAVSMVTSVVLYKRSQYYEDEAGIFAVGVLDFAERLHLSDDELPLHPTDDQLPLYEKAGYSDSFYAHRLYQRGCVASALIGSCLALVLIYYAFKKPVSEDNME